MNGMLSQTLLNSGPQGGLVSSTGWFLPSGLVPFRAPTARIPVSLLTYRSGPQYSRAVASGAIPQEENIWDYYARLQGDNGHEFTEFKTKILRSFSYGLRSANFAGHVGLTGPGAQSECRLQNVGSALARYTPGSWIKTDAQLIVAGTDFISASQPLASEADLMVSMAELLREGLPTSLISALMKPGASRKALIKGAGKDYLNYVFGITPLVSDFNAVWKTLTKIDVLIDQWIRDNAREVRRRRRKPRVTSVESLSVNIDSSFQNVAYQYWLPSSTTAAVGHTGSGNPSGTVSYVRDGTSKLETDVSFSSRFNYHLEELLVFDAVDGEVVGSNLALRLDLTLHALGLSPEDFHLLTMWNLVPFSWLVDWFVNVGDLLANVRAFQTAGLQLTYGYVTAFQKRRVTWKSGISFVNGSNTASASQGQTYVEKYVRRLRATPFGFGLKPGDLSLGQKAILAALASRAL